MIVPECIRRARAFAYHTFIMALSAADVLDISYGMHVRRYSRRATASGRRTRVHGGRADVILRWNTAIVFSARHYLLPNLFASFGKLFRHD